jgi:hypothetical protein
MISIMDAIFRDCVRSGSVGGGGALLFKAIIPMIVLLISMNFFDSG